jgi:hypothetical protein
MPELAIYHKDQKMNDRLTRLVDEKRAAKRAGADASRLAAIKAEKQKTKEKIDRYQKLYRKAFERYEREAHDRLTRRTAAAAQQLAKRKRTGVRKPLKVKPAPKRPTDREAQRVDRAVDKVKRGMVVHPPNED